jgi:acylphosphatase
MVAFCLLIFIVVARRFIIDGEVQGVGYRYFVLRAAACHQITGTVRNLPDGRVEVIAEGERAAIAEFKKDLAAGPRLARVSSLEEFDLAVTGRYRDFRVDY